MHPIWFMNLGMCSVRIFSKQHFNVIFWPWLSTQVCQNWILDIIFTNEIWSFIWLFPQRTDCQFFWWHRAMVWIFYCGSIGKIGWWILWSISITIYNSLEFSRSYNKIDSKKLQVHSMYKFLDISISNLIMINGE